MSFAALFYRIQSGGIHTIVPSEYLANSQLTQVFVGQSRDAFSIVEVSHSVIGVCTRLGVKYIRKYLNTNTNTFQNAKYKYKYKYNFFHCI